MNEVVLEHFENLVSEDNQKHDVLLNTQKWGFSGEWQLGGFSSGANSGGSFGEKLDYFSLLLAKKVER